MSHALDFLTGGGRMAEVIRAMDWSRTPLGPITDWPQSLRTTVSLALSSTFPISLAWGPEHTQIYNDGYWPICGDKHPTSMGQNFRECWASAFPVIGEAFESALAGQARYLESQRMFLDRLGYLEETFFTFSFSPIRDESGQVGGLFHPVTEMTANMLAERRVCALRDLGGGASDAGSVADACRRVVEILSGYELDVPFAVIYRLSDDGRRVERVAAAGVGPDSPVAPANQRLDDGSGWPFADALAEKRTTCVEDLAGRFGPFACGPYPEPPETARILSLRLAGVEAPFGFLVAGASARLPRNAPYDDFFELLGNAVSTTISNARAYEAERRRAEALVELDRAKTTFFSNVSHEFRTPLTLMLGPIEDAVKGDEQALAGDALQVVHRNTLRLHKLVNALLDFAHIEAGRARASYRPVDFAALVTDLASSFRAAAERAGLRLVVDCAPCDEPVWLDPDLFEKVVLNLLSNAFKFTFEGEIRVETRADDDGFHLVVADTGVGVPADELPNLFKRFHRVAGARSRSHEGSGIGLALVDELVRIHGGQIDVESELDEGTRFTIILPRGAAHLPEEHVAPRALPSTATGAAPYVAEALRWLDTADGATAEGAAAALPAPGPELDTPPGRVLIADDNADMRDYLARLLRPFWTVETVADGVAALEAVRAGAPDLLLTDVMMPRMDGAELVARLRADPETAELPIIILSARAGDEARVEGLEMGADDYLVKPFTARELRARIATHLQIDRLRRKARRAEARMRALFMQAPVAIVIYSGPEHRVELANRLVPPLVGGRELIVGRPVFESLPELAGQPFVEMLDRVYATGEPFVAQDFEVLLQNDAGEPQRRYFDLVVQPTRELDDEISGLMAVGYEVTAQHEMARQLREHQARLRAAVAAGSVATFTWDVEADTVRGDAQLAEIFDLDPSQLETGALSRADLRLRIHEADRERVDRIVDDALQSPREIALEFRTGVGEGARWVMARGRVARDAEGRPIQVSGALTDVTRQKHAERDLRRANRAKDEFLAMLGHELRNPLSPITTATQLMRLKGVTGADKELDVVERQVRHLSRLVDDLMDVARIARGRIKLEMAAVEVADIVTRAVEMARPLLEQQAHQVDLDVPSEGLVVRGDGARLSQVVSNLLTNAAKYTERGGHIRVRAGREGEEVVIEITDDGIGIEPEMLPRVFDRFAQEQQSLERSRGGLGLGLAIVKSLTESHGGRVQAYSEGPGRGSTFTVWLPADDEETTVVDLEEPDSTATDPGFAAPLRVLVVDDNVDAAKLLEVLLTRLGCAVQVAHDGPSGLEAAENLRPDLALVDIGLPVMDGYQVARRLRGRPELADTRLVAVTGYGHAAAAQESKRAGFERHLVKPVDLPQLRELLAFARRGGG